MTTPAPSPPTSPTATERASKKHRARPAVRTRAGVTLDAAWESLGRYLAGGSR